MFSWIAKTCQDNLFSYVLRVIFGSSHIGGGWLMNELLKCSIHHRNSDSLGSVHSGPLSIHGGEDLHSFGTEVPDSAAQLVKLADEKLLGHPLYMPAPSCIVTWYILQKLFAFIFDLLHSCLRKLEHHLLSLKKPNSLCCLALRFSTSITTPRLLKGCLSCEMLLSPLP